MDVISTMLADLTSSLTTATSSVVKKIPGKIGLTSPGRLSLALLLVVALVQPWVLTWLLLTLVTKPSLLAVLLSIQLGLLPLVAAAADLPQLFDQALRASRSGDFSAALPLWNQVLDLAPNDEIGRAHV